MSVDVYGIGNALVDLEYAVDDRFLVKHNLAKGTMQLTDAAGQQALLQHLNDVTRCAAQVSGGSAANTIYAFAALGGSAFYACRVGNDRLGQFYLDDLRSAGVGVDDRAQGLGTTGTCAVMVTPDGERTMNTHLGITGDLSLAQINLNPLDGAGWLYIEGYLATSPSAREAVRVARAQLHDHPSASLPTKIALSFSDPAMAQHARDGLLDLLGAGVDLLFCNEMEALLFSKQASLEDALTHLHQHAPLVVITLGGRGSLISRHDGMRQQVSAQVPHTVLDTNGAGDAYAGAFLFGLDQGFTLTDCGYLASAIASKVVSQYGPRLPKEAYRQTVLDLVTMSGAPQSQSLG